MTVPTFATLLTEYLTRAGISDSELARSIGVRRQTIFRWKEGLVERPRVRDDVLRCAAKLRLSAEERDLLLLAAGFPPESSPAEPLADTVVAPPAPPLPATVDEEAHPAAVTPESISPEQRSPLPLPAVKAVDHAPDESAQSAPIAAPLMSATDTASFAFFSRYRRYFAVGAAVLALSALFLLWRGLGLFVGPAAPTPVAGTPGSAFPAVYPTAAPNTLLVVIAPFDGYTVNEQYNVAGRLQDALRDEIEEAGLISTTIAIWPENIRNADYLAQLFAASGAAFVIWGEYDSGRVRVNLDGVNQIRQQRDFPLSAPTELITTISNTLPKESRVLALTALGRLLRNQGDLTRAGAAFSRALALEPDDAKTRALLNFYLGTLAERGGELRDLTRAIRSYENALAENPRLTDARYNLGTVYLNRSYLHPVEDPDFRADLDAAIEHLSTVIGLYPAYLDAYQNRGVARYERNHADDLADAQRDFSHIIAVDPQNSRAYFHRALVAIRAGDSAQWIADLQQTLTLSPTYYPADNGLCWGYALAQQAQSALAFCDQAVARDPTGASRDSRAIVYAELGRYAEAAADFRRYLDWVQTTMPPRLHDRYRVALVTAWIEQLEQGENPFTPALLDSLR
jgi:tetratricopeptide (TPR) repeat protein/transcriptional regulator with XRE-family HTH domain